MDPRKWPDNNSTILVKVHQNNSDTSIFTNTWDRWRRQGQLLWTTSGGHTRYTKTRPTCPIRRLESQIGAMQGREEGTVGRHGTTCERNYNGRDFWTYVASTTWPSLPPCFLFLIPVSWFMAGAASQAGDADSSLAPGLTSGLQGSVNVHRGALLFVPQWQCISSFVFYTHKEIHKLPWTSADGKTK